MRIIQEGLGKREHLNWTWQLCKISVVRHWEGGIPRKHHSYREGFLDFGHHLILNFCSLWESEGPVKFKLQLQKLEALNTEDRSQDLGPSSGSIYPHCSYTWSYWRDVCFKWKRVPIMLPSICLSSPLSPHWVFLLTMKGFWEEHKAQRSTYYANKVR